MGGASLSVEIGKSEAVGKFSALVVSAMMGCTISFTIPYALGIVDKKIHREVFFGFLCGIMTIPVGCILSGLLLGISLWQLIVTLLPLMIFSAIIACGLIFAPDFTVKAFAAFGAFYMLIKLIELPSALLPERTILDFAHYRQQTEIITNTLKAIGDEATMGLYHRNLWLSLAILAVAAAALLAGLLIVFIHKPDPKTESTPKPIKKKAKAKSAKANYQPRHYR